MKEPESIAINRLITSESYSPTDNLALEQQLLLKSQEEILLLYRNYPSVIVGRFQHIEAEIDISYCNEQNIEIVRRMTGGGTVYHDLGNINWAFITNKTATPLLDTNPTAPIIKFLQSHNLNACAGSRNEIVIGNQKISGTAAMVSKTRQLFHGTLLYHSDLNQLVRTLRGNPHLRGKHTPSVPSEVGNIKSLLPSPLSTEEFMQRMVCFFEEEYFLSTR